MIAHVPVYLDFFRGTLEWFERADALDFKARHKLVNIDVQNPCFVKLLVAFGRVWL